MSRKIAAWFISGMLSVAFLSSQQPAHADLNNGVSQGELAEMLVNVLGLTGGLPPAYTQMEAISVLMGAGVMPLGGWSIDRPVVLGDLAVVLVQGLDMVSEVEDPTDPASYIALLVERGAPLGTVGESLRILTPIGQNTDNAGVIFEEVIDARYLGSPRRLVYGQLITDIIRSLPSVPTRPRPVTPD